MKNLHKILGTVHFNLITNKYGMEPHVFSINNIDHMDYLMNIIKIIFLNCRCLYYNLIIYYAKTNDLHCGILLKSLASQTSNQRLSENYYFALKGKMIGIINKSSDNNLNTQISDILLYFSNEIENNE